MRVLYVSNLCLPQVYENLFEDKRYKSSEAVQKYHRIMAEGFALNGCEVISLGVVPANKNVRNKFISLPDGELNGVKYKHLRTINLPIIKQLLNAVGVYFKVLKYGNKESFVICDGLSYLASKAAVLACKLKRLKSVVIITDLPEFFAGTDEKTVKRYNALFDKFTAYVVLTEKMIEKLGYINKPYVVLEGQVDSLENKMQKIYKKESKKVIMYAGTVQSQYGLKMLVEGFILANLSGYELHVYGNGDYAEEIDRISKVNSNVKHFPSQPNDVIVEKEKEAYILVNPRPADEEYTKYSFPSKNMEYMVSGTAVLTTSLPGMPEEYKQYVYLIENETADGVCKAFKKISELSEEDIISKGRLAREFVLSKKNNKMQTNRIIELITANC
jgi:hypothetical protein